MFRRIPLTAVKEETSEWNFEQEVIVRLDSEGLEEGFELRELSTEENIEYTSEKRLIMKNIQKGEYVQIWYSLRGHEGSGGTEGVEIDRSGVTEGGKIISPSVQRPLVEQEIEVELLSHLFLIHKYIFVYIYMYIDIILFLVYKYIYT
jgi:hypothetical protein